MRGVSVGGRLLTLLICARPSLPQRRPMCSPQEADFNLTCQSRQPKMSSEPDISCTVTHIWTVAMDQNPINAYARLVLQTLGVRAAIDRGDFQEGLKELRRDVAVRLRMLEPKLSREAMASLLGVTPRVVDDWWSQARQQQEEQGEDAEQTGDAVATSQDIRVFLSVMRFLFSAGESYSSLGRIVDQVKADVSRKLTTRDIKERLDAYVASGKLERPEDDPEMYRLAVRLPAWVEENRLFKRKLFENLAHLFYHLGYQNFVATREAGARVQIYDIPESRTIEFAEIVKKEFLAFLQRLESIEAEFQTKDAGEPRSHMALLFMLGRGTGEQLKQLLLARNDSASSPNPSEERSP
mgnify:CR=1 FL=1